MIDVRIFASGEVCELAGLSANVFNEWCVKGILIPIDGGEGSGDHRRFTVMQTVGIIIGARLRASARSCALSFVKIVVEAFADMTEEELAEQFQQDHTHFSGFVHMGRPYLEMPKYDDMIDVTEVLEQVLAF